MIFKEEYLQHEFHTRHTLLQQMAFDFEQLSRSIGVEPVITRILERVTGSSGVHEVGRAIDFRDEHAGKSLYTDKQVRFLLAKINAKYRRTDGKLTLIHHSFNGGMSHFHLQLAPSLKVYEVQNPSDNIKDPSNPSRALREFLSLQDVISHAPSAVTALGRNAIHLLLYLATSLLVVLSVWSHLAF